MHNKYNLGLRAGVDFTVKRNHWLPGKLNVACIAFGRTLYLRGSEERIPHHEFLHIAQFHKFGVIRVVCHYLLHLTKNYLRLGSFGESFREVPFEKEARAYETSLD
jgi:hypothetical protein